MSSRPMLEGQVVTPSSDEITRLRREIAGLEQELSIAHAENAALRRQSSAATHALKTLKKLLSDPYKVLQVIMGELEIVEVDDDDDSNATVRRGGNDAVWDKWKSDLGGACAKIISALQERGELSASQLRVAAQTPRTQTIYDATSRMFKLGLLNRNGGKYSLKEL
jgi:chromosome segregation ATPase